MPNLLHIASHGPLITASTYWDTEAAAQWREGAYCASGPDDTGRQWLATVWDRKDGRARLLPVL